MTKETIGARIRRLRGELPAKELARRVSIDPATLSQIERGKRKPSLTTIEKMAEYFGISRDELLEGRAAEPAARHGEHTSQQEATGEAQPPPAPGGARHTDAPVDTTLDGEDFGVSAAIRAQVYATLATVFAELAGELEVRATPPQPARQAAATGTTERRGRPSGRRIAR